jgi:hypothetical protein
MHSNDDPFCSAVRTTGSRSQNKYRKGDRTKATVWQALRTPVIASAHERQHILPGSFIPRTRKHLLQLRQVRPVDFPCRIVHPDRSRSPTIRNVSLCPIPVRRRPDSRRFIPCPEKTRCCGPFGSHMERSISVARIFPLQFPD